MKDFIIVSKIKSYLSSISYSVTSMNTSSHFLNKINKIAASQFSEQVVTQIRQQIFVEVWDEIDDQIRNRVLNPNHI